MATPPKTIDTGYLDVKKRLPVSDGTTVHSRIDAIGERIDVLGKAVQALIDIEGSDAEDPDPNEDPALTAARNRRKQARHHERTLKAWLTAALAALSLMTTAATMLYSWMQGYASDAAARALEVQAMQETTALVQQHEARLAEIVQREQTVAVDLKADLRRIAELQSLQSEYHNDVLAAIASKRKPPQKSARLIAAEAAVARSSAR